MPDLLRRIFLWLIVAGIAVGLPLQSVSAAVAGVMGSRHAHRAADPRGAVEPRQAADSMAGWKDFRRADHHHGAPSVRPADLPENLHSHEAGARHRHDPLDESVIRLDASADMDRAAAEAAQAGASFVFVATVGLTPLPAAIEAIDEGWRPSSAQNFSSQYPRRIERPPQHIA